MILLKKAAVPKRSGGDGMGCRGVGIGRRIDSVG
jgi:hypothetical protein